MTDTIKKQSVTVLGATGSVGASTVDLLCRDRDRFLVEAVTAHRNAEALARIARRCSARFAAVADPAAYAVLKDALAGSGIEPGAGPEAILEAAMRPADRVMAAIVGAAGLEPTAAAVTRGATVLLANKECLVCAGTPFMATARRSGATILPVDSEHSAIFQALEGRPAHAVETVTITASGGPFRTWTATGMSQASPEQAMQHPNWTMGAKISIDSATLMNKGLELIEAHYLFALHPEQLHVVVHPESIVHGYVSFIDGSVMAQLAAPDMRTPIAFALHWPARGHAPTARLDLTRLAKLTFEPPDLERFPALSLARSALAAGGRATAILNAANEVAVEAFLARRIGFNDIARLVARVLDAMSGPGGEPESVAEALALDEEARRVARADLPTYMMQAG